MVASQVGVLVGRMDFEMDALLVAVLATQMVVLTVVLKVA